MVIELSASRPQKFDRRSRAPGLVALERKGLCNLAEWG